MKGFRVWSNYWKKYATEAELHMDGSVDAIFEDDSGVPHHENTDLVVEFDTGLKDGNNKEICDGDIVRVSYGYNYEVRQFRTGAWRIGRDDLYAWADSSEVIGNVHENKELLDD